MPLWSHCAYHSPILVLSVYADGGSPGLYGGEREGIVFPRTVTVGRIISCGYDCAFESVFRGFVMTTCYVASGSDALKAIRIKFYFHMSPLEHLSLEVRQYSLISSNRTNGW